MIRIVVTVNYVIVKVYMKNSAISYNVLYVAQIVYCLLVAVFERGFIIILT